MLATQLFEKASRPPVLVHTLLDRQQKIGSVLHLMDYCAIEAATANWDSSAG
jgi:hypothetical protein